MKLILFILAASLTFSSCAQVTLLEQLSFGKIVISDNQSISSITLLPSNTNTLTNKIYLLEKGHAAELLLEGYPARIQVNVSDFVSDQPLNNIFGGASLILNQLIYNATITTDTTGTALLRVGGQLSTSGDGNTYKDGIFDTTIEVTLNY